MKRDTLKPVSRKPRERRRGGQRELSGALNEVLERRFHPKRMRDARILLSWTEAVGKQLARTTKALSLRDGVMTVQVQDHTAVHFFTTQRQIYLERLRAVLGEAAPKELKFQYASVKEPVEAKAKPSLKLSPADRRSVGELSEGASPGNLEAVKRAAEALLLTRRHQGRDGYTPCVVCGTLTGDAAKPCVHCRITMTLPECKWWQSQLSRNPDAWLAWSEHEIGDVQRCARHAALTESLEQLRTLALNVLHLSRFKRRKAVEELAVLKTQLHFVASAHLGLRLEKPMALVGKRDWTHLPENIHNVLEVNPLEVTEEPTP